jgi:peroxiredoxin
VLLGAVCWALYGLFRQNGRLLLRVEALEAAAATAPLAQPDRAFADRSLARSRIERAGLAAGTIAPAFRLPALDGGDAALTDYSGRWLLLVFSDPDCAPCQALLPRLARAARKTDIEVLIVSRGDAEANRRKLADAGVTLRVALQRQWEISRLYAKFATPIGYLIDPQGRIADTVAAGAADILALLSNDDKRERTGFSDVPTRSSVH